MLKWLLGVTLGHGAGANQLAGVGCGTSFDRPEKFGYQKTPRGRTSKLKLRFCLEIDDSQYRWCRLEVVGRHQNSIPERI